MDDKGLRANIPIHTLVNRTIEQLSSQGGGAVIIPVGKWLSGHIELKSFVELHIARGTEIAFGGYAENYLPAVFARHEGVEIMGPDALIYANNQESITITGEGRIPGPDTDAEVRKRPNGASVVERGIPWDMPVEQRIYGGMDGRAFYRPRAISPINCRNVLIERITMERSTLWSAIPIYYEGAIIRGIAVNSTEVPSGDGIDIESCKNILIEYCILNYRDDCFTLEAGRADDGLRVEKATENIVIRHSLTQHGHGDVAIGSETAGMVKNLYAHDCVFNDTRTGVRFRTRRSREGGSNHTIYERLHIINVGKTFTQDLLGNVYYMGELAARYPEHAVDHLTPNVSNTVIKDFIVGSSRQFFTVNSIPEIPFSNTLIGNGTVRYQQLTSAL